jgi:hypothetical protein
VVVEELELLLQTKTVEPELQVLLAEHQLSILVVVVVLLMALLALAVVAVVDKVEYEVAKLSLPEL